MSKASGSFPQFYISYNSIYFVMKIKILTISIIAFILCQSCKTTEMAVENPQNWFNMAVAEDVEIYVDTTSIQREGGRVFACEKRIYTTAESRAKYIDNVKKLNLKYHDIKKWNDFSYCIYSCEYECANKRYRILAVEDYDSTGKHIARTTPNKNNIEWMNVETETVGDYTFFFICDYGN